MECLDTRERLTEYAVSTLPDRERREVDAHLQWCAGCRKEARELREAASLVGLSLGQSEPPPELEHRIVHHVSSSARRGHPSKARVGWRRTLTILAAVVGLVGMSAAGWLFANQRSTKANLEQQEHQARAFAERLQQLLAQFPSEQTQPRAVTRAILTPSSGSSGGGGALRVVSPHFEDIALVTVGGLPKTSAPYRVWLTRVSGKRLFVGTISVGTGGEGSTEAEFASDLLLYHYVEVRDHAGRLVLKGAFQSGTSG